GSAQAGGLDDGRERFAEPGRNADERIAMDLQNLERLKQVTRRKFFRQCGTGMGALALASLLKQNLFAAPAQTTGPAGPHFKPKAKNIIYLFQSGGPSHLDLFDYKPELIKRNGQTMPDEILKNIRLAQ